MSVSPLTRETSARLLSASFSRGFRICAFVYCNGAPPGAGKPRGVILFSSKQFRWLPCVRHNVLFGGGGQRGTVKSGVDVIVVAGRPKECGRPRGFTGECISASLLVTLLLYMDSLSDNLGGL